MDKSFLSSEDVIKASRKFVCIRLATYEDEAEAEFLKSVYVGRTGDLENTVFAMISPDTKRNLSTPGRSPRYASPTIMAENMISIANRFDSVSQIKARTPRLPQMKNVRLGVNVASCDGLPVVICYSKSESEMAEMHASIVNATFNAELAGKFIYASTLDASDLETIKGFKGKPGILIVNPDQFGLEGTVAHSFKPNVDVEDLKDSMVAFANGTTKVSKDRGSHVRAGGRSGKSWETEITVTDTKSLKAMEGRENRGGGRRPLGGPGGSNGPPPRGR